MTSNGQKRKRVQARFVFFEPDLIRSRFPMKVGVKNMKQKKYKIKYVAYLLVFTTAFFAYAQKSFASQITSERVEELVNISRVQDGFPELRISETLNSIAAAKLNDMIEKKYFAHTSPEGLTPWHWFEANGYDYKYAGENLAMNFSSAEAQHEAWMESPTHKKNIMNPLFQEIGVAVGSGEINGKTTLISVQEFGTLATAAEGANNPENFSGSKKPNLIEQDLNKPTVLSTKDSSLENNSELNNLNKKEELIQLSDNLGDSKVFVTDMFEKMAILFMLAALMAIPLSFVIASFHTSRIAKKLRKHGIIPIPIKFLDNANKSIKVKVHLI